LPLIKILPITTLSLLFSGRNPNWFWNAWFFSNIDAATSNIRVVNKNYQVTIRNIGGFPVPVDIRLNFRDGSSQAIHKSPEIWAENQKQLLLIFPDKKPLQRVELVVDIFVDADESTNLIEYQQIRAGTNLS
jgi:hypothetical protein